VESTYRRRLDKKYITRATSFQTDPEAKTLSRLPLMNKYVMTVILSALFTAVLIKGTSTYYIKGVNNLYDEVTPVQGYDLKTPETLAPKADMQTQYIASLTPVAQNTGSLIDKPIKSNVDLPPPPPSPSVAQFKPSKNKNIPPPGIPPDVITMFDSAPF
jgi:hypothetical protein